MSVKCQFKKLIYIKLQLKHKQKKNITSMKKKLKIKKFN